MDLAAHWLQENNGKSCAILAKEQTQGRGRRGRTWQSMDGNLFLSLGFPLSLEQNDFPLLSFVSAVALGEALLHYDSSLPLTYKWPNDLLVDKAKIAGILLETEVTKGERHMVVGMGVNLQVSPSIAEYSTTSLLKVSQKKIMPRAFLSILLPLFDKYRDLWLKGAFSEVSQKWLERASGLQQEITILVERGPVTGLFQGIDTLGRLVLVGADGVASYVSTGDVIKGHRYDNIRQK